MELIPLSTIDLYHGTIDCPKGFEIDRKIIKSERYFKAFQAIKCLFDTESQFKEALKKWKKEKKINVLKKL